MLNETAEQKEKKIFEAYKRDLLVLADYCKNKDFYEEESLRFLCIQYKCSFPKIDPYKMAVALADYGINILFDDSAISKAENKKQERKFYSLLRAEQSKNKKAR